MDFELTPEQEEIREVARQFAEDELGDKIAPFDERHQFPFEIVNKLAPLGLLGVLVDRKSTRLNSSHGYISYAVFCLKKKKKTTCTLLTHNITISKLSCRL